MTYYVPIQRVHRSGRTVDYVCEALGASQQIDVMRTDFAKEFD